MSTHLVPPERFSSRPRGNYAGQPEMAERDADEESLDAYSDSDVMSLQINDAPTKQTQRSWRAFVGPEVYESIPDSEQQRQELIFTLVLRLQSFADDLDFIQRFLTSLSDSEVFATPLLLLYQATEKLAEPNSKLYETMQLRQHEDFPFVGVIGDLLENAAHEFESSNAFKDYADVVHEAMSNLATIAEANPFVIDYRATWEDWSMDNYGERKRIDATLLSPLRHLLKVSTLVDRISKRLPSELSGELHQDSVTLPKVLCILSALQKGLDRNREDFTVDDDEAGHEPSSAELSSATAEPEAVVPSPSSVPGTPSDEKILSLDEALYWEETVTKSLKDTLTKKEMERQSTMFEAIRNIVLTVEGLNFLRKVIDQYYETLVAQKKADLDDGKGAPVNDPALSIDVSRRQTGSTAGARRPSFSHQASVHSAASAAFSPLSHHASVASVGSNHSGPGMSHRPITTHSNGASTPTTLVPSDASVKAPKTLSQAFQSKAIRRVFVDPTDVFHMYNTFLGDLRDRQNEQHPLLDGIGDLLLANILEATPVLYYQVRLQRVLKEFKRMQSTSNEFDTFMNKIKYSQPRGGKQDIAQYFMELPQKGFINLRLQMKTLIELNEKCMKEQKEKIREAKGKERDKIQRQMSILEEEEGRLKEAKEELDYFMKQLNEEVGRVTSTIELEELNTKLRWPRYAQYKASCELNDKSRRLLRKGAAKLRDRGTDLDVYLILFDNVLLITQEKGDREKVDKLKVIAKPIPLDLIAFEGETTSPAFPVGAPEFASVPPAPIRSDTFASVASVGPPQAGKFQLVITHLGQRREDGATSSTPQPQATTGVPPGYGGIMGGLHVLRFGIESEQKAWAKDMMAARDTYFNKHQSMNVKITSADRVCIVPRKDRNLRHAYAADSHSNLPQGAASTTDGSQFLFGSGVTCAVRVTKKHLLVGTDDGCYVVPDGYMGPQTPAAAPIQTVPDVKGPTTPVRLPMNNVEYVTALDVLLEEGIVVLLANKELIAFSLRSIMSHVGIDADAAGAGRGHAIGNKGGSGGAGGGSFSLFGKKGAGAYDVWIPVQGQPGEWNGVHLKKDAQFQWLKVLYDDGSGLGGGVYGANGLSRQLEQSSRRPSTVSISSGKDGKDNKDPPQLMIVAARVASLDSTYMYVWVPSGKGLNRISKFFVPSTRATSISLFKNVFVVHTDDNGFIKISVDLSHTDTSAGKLPELNKESAYPLAMFRAGSGNFLVCYDTRGFFIDGKGAKVPDLWDVRWASHATAFALVKPFLYVFDPDFIEICDFNTGARLQIIPVRSARYLATITSYDHPSGTSVDEPYFIMDMWSPVPIQERSIYRLRRTADSYKHYVAEVAPASAPVQMPVPTVVPSTRPQLPPPAGTFGVQSLPNNPQPPPPRRLNPPIMTPPNFPSAPYGQRPYQPVASVPLRGTSLIYTAGVKQPPVITLPSANNPGNIHSVQPRPLPPNQPGGLVPMPFTGSAYPSMPSTYPGSPPGVRLPMRVPSPLPPGGPGRVPSPLPPGGPGYQQVYSPPHSPKTNYGQPPRPHHKGSPQLQHAQPPMLQYAVPPSQYRPVSPPGQNPQYGTLVYAQQVPVAHGQPQAVYVQQTPQQVPLQQSAYPSQPGGYVVAQPGYRPAVFGQPGMPPPGHYVQQQQQQQQAPVQGYYVATSAYPQQPPQQYHQQPPSQQYQQSHQSTYSQYRG
ncbi:hypothetical protein BJ742DRAFT_821447 [Cladochytrium replicatum]|nr:hypothetical protein BJ742DRAFT_821447 [Cladochytrium replicatum]